MSFQRRFEFVYVGLPNFESRQELFRHYLKKHHSVTNEEFQILASMTKGYTASDICQIVRKGSSFYYHDLFKLKAIKNPIGRKLSFTELQYVIKNTKAKVDNRLMIETREFNKKHQAVVMKEDGTKQNTELKSLNSVEALLCRLLAPRSYCYCK